MDPILLMPLRVINVKLNIDRGFRDGQDTYDGFLRDDQGQCLEGNAVCSCIDTPICNFRKNLKNIYYGLSQNSH